MLTDLSKTIASLVKASKKHLIHIGSEEIPNRTGLLWGSGLALTFARQADDGESVPYYKDNGEKANAKVKAYDHQTGLTLLEVEGSAEAWKTAALPEVGSLAVTVAYASPDGVEARLDLIRFVGKDSIQTDGQAFPGFSGGAVLDPEGRLLGIVAENRSGNSGFILPVADLEKLVKDLKDKGSLRKAYLGVNTQPVKLSAEQSQAAGRETGLLITGVQSDSPAAKAALAAGDILLSIAKTPMDDPSSLWKVVSTLRPGTPVEATVLAGSAVKTVTITPAAR